MQKESVKNSRFDQAQIGIAHFNATHREQGSAQARERTTRTNTQV